MINKVDGNHYSVYTQQKNLKIPNAGEKFNLDLKNLDLKDSDLKDLDQKRDELASDEKDKARKESSEKTGQEEQLGVKLELSGNGRSAGAEWQGQATKTQESGATGQKALLGSIQDFVAKAIAAVQDFFRKIWSSQPEESAIQEPLETKELVVDVLEPESVQEDGEDAVPMDEESRNREIQKSLRSGDVAQAIRFLTENGKKTLAKNSTLLTSYDRNGKIVEVGASDRQRVLYGDKNSLKL